MSDPVPYENSGSKYIALGLKVDYSQGWPQLQYPDNTPVPDTLVGTAFEWEDASYPKNDNVSECVAFNENKKVVNMECNITGGDHLTYLGCNSIALLKSQQTFQQTFEQSTTGCTTTLPTLLKSRLRFQQSY